MALEQADGSITIDTRLSTKGFAAGSKELRNAVDTLVNRVNTVGKAAEKAFSGNKNARQVVNDLVRGLSAEYDSLIDKIHELEDAQDDLQTSMQKSQAAEALSSMREQAETLHGAIQELQASGKWVSLGTAIGSVAEKMAKLAGASAQASKSLAKSAAGKAVNGLKKIGGKAAEAGRHIMSLGKQTGKSVGTMTGSLGKLLRYGFGIRALFSLLSKLKSTITAGMGGIAKLDAPVNAAVSSMSNALSTLKNSLATAFAPIVTAVAPYVTYFINLLEAAIQKIAAFFSALTGGKTYIKATQVQGDYAASLDNSTNSTNANTAATKKNQRQLAGFDELEVLKASDNSGSGSAGGGGAGGGAGSSTPQYEYADVPNEITSFVEQLKNAFEAGDYTEVGAIIGEKINEQFARLKDLIKWDNVGETITKYVNAFCDIFNGMVDAIDWKLIGETFGEGINTIVNTLDLLITGIDWKLLGKSLSEGFNGLVNTVDWNKLGKTLGDAFGAALNFIVSALDGINWAVLGSKLAIGVNSLVTSLTSAIENIQWSTIGSDFTSGLNNFVKCVNWSKIGELIGMSFNSALTVINNVVTEFDYMAAGSSLASLFNSAITTINWSTLTSTISSGIAGALNGISSYLQAVDYGAVRKAVEDALCGIKWADMASALASAIGAGLGGLGALIGGFISDAFEGIGSYFDAKVKECGGNVVAGIFNGIKDAIASIGTWIKTNIFDPFLKGFKSAFGIHSPATTMKEPGKNIILGLLDGIIEGMKDIGKWVKTNILAPIKNALAKPAEAINVAIGLAKNGWETVSAWVGAAAQKGSAAVSKAISLGKDGWETVSAWVGAAAQKGSVAVSKAISLGKAGWETVSAWVGAAAQKGSVAVSKAVSLTKNKWETVSAWLNDTAQKGSAAVSKAVSLTKNKWGTVSAWLNDTAQKGSAAVSKAVSLTKNKWKTVSAWLNDTAQKGSAAVSKAVSLTKNKWKTVSAWLNDTDQLGKLAVNKKIGLLRNGWTTVTDWVKKFMGSGTVNVSTTVSGTGGAGRKFASGGVINSSGRATWWNTIPKYASGTRNAHGSMFVAGEAGPEIVGHVGGRTEVLNRSQLASTMYAAVIDAMSLAVRSLGSYVVNTMANVGAAIINEAGYTAGTVASGHQDIINGIDSVLSILSAIDANVSYYQPAMATGTILPYSIGAMFERQTADLQNTLDSNNEILMQAMVSAISSQTMTLVNAMQKLGITSVNSSGSVQDAIDEINRRTAMFNASPISI